MSQHDWLCGCEDCVWARGGALKIDPLVQAARRELRQRTKAATYAALYGALGRMGIAEPDQLIKSEPDDRTSGERAADEALWLADPDLAELMNLRKG